MSCCDELYIVNYLLTFKWAICQAYFGAVLVYCQCTAPATSSKKTLKKCVIYSLDRPRIPQPTGQHKYTESRRLCWQQPCSTNWPDPPLPSALLNSNHFWAVSFSKLSTSQQWHGRVTGQPSGNTSHKVEVQNCGCSGSNQFENSSSRWREKIWIITYSVPIWRIGTDTPSVFTSKLFYKYAEIGS